MYNQQYYRVERLFLVGAKKVEKQYFGSHLFRKPHALRELLIEGVSQAASDCQIPKVTVRKSLYSFFKDFDEFYPNGKFDELHLLIAHPQKDKDVADILPTQKSIADSTTLTGYVENYNRLSVQREVKHLNKKVVIAIGKEIILFTILSICLINCNHNL